MATPAGGFGSYGGVGVRWPARCPAAVRDRPPGRTPGRRAGGGPGVRRRAAPPLDTYKNYSAVPRLWLVVLRASAMSSTRSAISFGLAAMVAWAVMLCGLPSMSTTAAPASRTMVTPAAGVSWVVAEHDVGVDPAVHAPGRFLSQSETRPVPLHDVVAYGHDGAVQFAGVARLNDRVVGLSAGPFRGWIAEAEERQIDDSDEPEPDEQNPDGSGT